MPAGAPEWRTAPAPRPVREPQTASGPVVWNLAQQAMLPVVRQSFYPAYPSRFALMAPKLPNEYSYDTGKLYRQFRRSQESESFQRFKERSPALRQASSVRELSARRSVALATLDALRGFSRHLDASAPRHLDASLQGPASQATDQVASVGASASHGASVLTRPASRESSVCVDFDPVDTFQPEVVDAAPHAPAKPVYRPHTPIAKSFGDYANLHRPSSAGPVTSATARGYAPTRPPSGAASRHADRKCLDHLLATALPGRTISTSSRRPPDDETGHFAAAVPAPTAPAPRHASLRALRPPSAGAAAAGAAAARQGRFRRPATASALPRMQSWQLAMQHGGTAQHGGAPQHAGVASPRRFDTDDTPFEAERPAHAQRASDGSDFSARDGASNLLQGNCLHGDCLHGDCLHGDWLDPAIRNLLDDTANDARVPTILCAVPLHLVASNSRLPCDAYVLRVVSALKSHDGRLAEKLAPKTDFAQWVTFSRHGAVYHRRGEAQADDFVSLKQWSYEAKTHRKLVEKKTFSQFKARKYFNAWKGALPAAARKRRTRGLVANSLLSEPKLAAVLSFAMDSLANFQDESGRLGEWADGDEEPLDSHGFMLHHLSSCKRLHDFAVDMVRAVAAQIELAAMALFIEADLDADAPATAPHDAYTSADKHKKSISSENIVPMKTTIVLRHHAAAADEAPEPGVVPTHHTDLARRRTLLAKLQRCTALVQFMVQGAFRALAIQCTLEFEDWYSGNAPMEASVDGGSGDGSGAGDEQGDNSSPPGDAAFGTASPAAPAFAKLLAAARPRPLLVVNVDVVSDATGCLLATSPALASQLEMVKLLQMALLFALKSAPELKFRPDTLSAPLNLLGNDSEPAKWLEHTMVSVPRLDLLLALKHDADAFYGEAPALAHSHAWIAETTWVVGVFADAGFIKATRQCGRVVRSESLRVAGMLRKYEKTLKLHSVVQEWTLSMSVSKPSTVQALLQRFSDETLPLGAAFRVDREAWLCQNEKGFDTAANRMHWLHDNVLKKHRAETLEMADSVVSADDALVDAAGAAKARKGSSHVVLKAARARLVGAADAALGCAHAFMPSLFGVQAVELVIDLSAKNEHLASGAATLDEFLEQLAQLRDLGAGWEALEKRVEDVAALHEKVVLLQLTSSHSPAIHKEAYAAVFVALDPAAQGHAQLQLLKKKLAGALSKALAVDADAAQRAADAASGPPRVQRTGSASSVKVKLARVSSGLSLSAPPPPLQRVLSTPRRRRDSDGSVSFSEEPLMCLETHLAEAVAEAWAQLQTALNSTLLHAMKRRNIFRNEMYERAKLIARDVSAVRDGADSPLLVHASTAPATALAALAKWSVKHADVTVRALALREAQTLFNSHFSAASASSKCRDKPYQAPTFLEDLVLTVSIENGGSSAVDDSLANQLVDLFSLSDTRFAQRRLDLQTQHWACLETLGEAVAAWKLAKLDSDFSAGKPHNILLAAADAAQGVWLALGGADRASVSAPVSPGSPGSPSRAAFFSNARKASYGSSSAVTNAPLSAPPRDDDDADDATARTANTCESLKTSASEVALREYSSMNPGLEQRLKSEIAAARALAAHALPLTAEFMGLEARSLSHWVGLAKLLPALTAGIETSSASLSLTLEELAIKGRLAVGALDADLAKRPRQIAEAVYNGRMQHFLQVLGASVLETWSEADEFSSQAMIAAGFAVADAPASVPHREILAILQGALAAPRGRLRQACRACLKAVERSIEERTLPKPPAAVPAAVALAAEAFVAERHAEWRSRCDAGEALLNEVATLVAEAALLRSLRVSSGPQSAVPQAVATALEAAVSALRSGLDELRGVDKLGIFLGDEDDAQRSLQLATFEFAKAKDGFEGTRTLLRDFLEDQTVEDWLERQRLKNEPSVPADAAAAADAADGAARPAPPLQARLGDALSFANFGPALDAGAPHEVALDTGEA